MRIQTYERALIAVALLVTALIPATAQDAHYRVIFRDKGPESYAPGTPAYDTLIAQFSPKALQRRSRMGMDPLVDSTDAMVYGPYVLEVRRVTPRIVLSLPWFNSVVVQCPQSDSAQLAALSCVASVQPVSRRGYQPLADISCDPPVYGSDDIQHRVLQTPPLHNGGVYGTGVLLGVIDTGFRWKSMSTLSQHLKVIEEYDLIQGDSTTDNDTLDPQSQDAHGSAVLSLLGGWQHDSLIGVAPFASYILAKTEDMRYEQRIEEETYAAAVMKLESRGVDIITSSLGYRLFDEGQDSTLYSDLDGSTTWASRALNIAASRGVLCVTSAGNDGPAGRSIITPADADSVMTIGALAQDGVSPWMKSSWGPTAKGRQKPDFATPGVQIRCQGPDGNFSRQSGTSLSAPIFAGGLALLRELYPSASPWQIREVLRQSAQRGTAVDTVAGFGSPDLTSAARLLGPSLGPPVISTRDAKQSVIVAVYTSSPVRAQLILRDPITGATSVSVGTRIEDPWYVFPIESQQLFRDQMDARIVVATADTLMSASYPRDTSWFSVPRNALVVPCGVRLPGSVTSIETSSMSSGARIANHPLHSGQQCFTIVGTIPPDVQPVIMHATTRQLVPSRITNHSSEETSICVEVPLYRGVYIISYTTASQNITIPMLVR